MYPSPPSPVLNVHNLQIKIIPALAGFQRRSRLVNVACVSWSVGHGRKSHREIANGCKTTRQKSLGAFVWCLGMSCHELETRHTMKYSLDGSESELDQVTESANSAKTASWLMV